MKFEKIKSIKKVTKKTKVYNLKVKDNENYFVNNILTHNCSGSCKYCFSYTSKANNPSVDFDNLKLKAVNIPKLIEIMEGKHPDNPYYKYFFKKRKVLHIGGLADNFDNTDRKFNLSYPLIEYLLKTGYPTVISTKFLFLDRPEYKELFTKYKDTNKCAIQASIITIDEDKARDIEGGIPTPEERFKQLEELKELGYYTVARIRPFIIGLTDLKYDKFLDRVAKAKVSAISTEFYCLDFRATERDKEHYRWMSKVLGFDIMKYYNKLSPNSRGSYKRLNRNVKERYIKAMYKICKDNGIKFACSDPDFKELCQTNNCCGAPDDWGIMKNQLTNLLRKAFKKYHDTGEKFIHFVDMMEDINEDEWKHQQVFMQDEICKTAMQSSELKRTTHFDLIRNRWNNPKSKNSPYVYFDGKMRPHHVDNDGNIVYEYIESPYEREWKKEGLL